MMGLLAALAVSMVSWAQEPFTVKVWPDGPAEDNGITADEKMTKEGRVLNARTAELTDPGKKYRSRGGDLSRWRICSSGHAA